MNHTVNIARDFSWQPRGRFIRDNNTNSAEQFRQQHLEGPIASGDTVTVELDGTIGYSSSFLEEAFGGVVRSLKMTPEALSEQLKFVSTDPVLLTEIDQYISEARP